MDDPTTIEGFKIAVILILSGFALYMLKLFTDFISKYTKTWMDIKQQELENSTHIIKSTEMEKNIEESVNLAKQKDIVNKKDEDTPAFTGTDLKNIAMDHIKKVMGDTLDIGVDLLSDKIEAQVAKSNNIPIAPAPTIKVDPPAEIIIKDIPEPEVKQ